MSKLRIIKRRQFLLSLVSLMGSWLASNACGGCISRAFSTMITDHHKRRKSTSSIVEVFHPGATDGTGGKDNINLNDEALRQMVDEGIKAFTGKKDLKEAWSDIIPDPKKKIAIKINCQVVGIYTKAKVVKPIIDGLLIRGVNPENIIVYDKTDNAFSYAGFSRNGGEGVKAGTVKDFGGYHRFLYSRLATLLTGKGIFSGQRYYCDYLINVPVLKALDGFSGVTISMKNHYGSIANPHDHHKDMMTYIPELNNLKYIKEKTRLVIVDAIFLGYKTKKEKGNRGKGSRDQRYIDILNELIISDDPVAVDFFGWQIIEEKRKERGLPKVSPEPVFIHEAARMGLGISDPKKINKITIDMTNNNI